ncbi:MAG: UDP-N-acetylglucosamine 2-epimerase (non-hydrolyzing) [Saprospiraceae bacterium]|nr:UDP-N-acetylglucosamine 2-epimerase (non-hydrolyzing) [Saprospiraceae bacterium]
MKKILQVVGARPNFMKVAPVHTALQQYTNVRSLIVHTGQHADYAMSEVFFRQLNMPEPLYFLGIRSGTHTGMTASIMLEFERVLIRENPRLVVVVGDVTSTLACALTSVRCGIPVAHVESGLRSRDREMPEEINRLLTDQLSEWLFTTERDANENLIAENIPADKIHFVGNCMIDSLQNCLPLSDAGPLLQSLELHPGAYALMTMHRPSNVDDREGLERVIEIVRLVTSRIPLVFPVHPRTRDRLMHFSLWNQLTGIEGLYCMDPLGYLEFIGMMRSARMLLTDSGGVQEETTYLGIPCLTFRRTTERPVTVERGTNVLIDSLSAQQLEPHFIDILEGRGKGGEIPEGWDGHAAERIAAVLHQAVC